MNTYVRVSGTDRVEGFAPDFPKIQLALPVAAFSIGYYFWQGVEQYVGLGALLLCFFLMGHLNRWIAYSTYAAFHMGFTVPIIAASRVFMDIDAATSYLVWIGHALLCAIPFLLLRGRWLGLRAALVFIIFLVPPFGYLAPNNPALAVGALFPALRWVGLPLTAIALWAVMEARDMRGARVVVACIGLASIAANAYWMHTQHVPPANWHAADTSLGAFADNITKRRDITNLRLPIDIGVRAYEYRDTGTDQVWFLPEGIIHDKEPVTDLIWHVALTGRNATAIVGEYFRAADGSLYSGVRVLGKKRDDTGPLKAARAAITFPVTMWHPWRKDDNYPMFWPNVPVEFDGQILHLSWCAESTIVWPHLAAAFFSRPTVMVSLENRWSIAGLSLESAQSAAAQLNARFLGASLLQAINR